MVVKSHIIVQFQDLGSTLIEFNISVDDVLVTESSEDENGAPIAIAKKFSLQAADGYDPQTALIEYLTQYKNNLNQVPAPAVTNQEV